MATSTIQSRIQKAGDIEILEISIDTDILDQPIDIKLFVGELNLFEDMFSPGLYGNLLIVDAANLPNLLELTGEELITIKVRTPTMGNEALIHRRFKAYSITNRQMISDTGKQSYIIHFCSPEVLIDQLTPLYKTFTGQIDTVVKDIFDTYIAMPRALNVGKSQLVVSSPTRNQVKFTSPGWRPVQCINWLASKSIGTSLKNPGYLFYESNKRFYYANVEDIIDTAIRNGKNNVYQNYKLVAKKVNPQQGADRYAYDIGEAYSKVEHMEVVQSHNYFKNIQNGYYGNKLFSIDMLTKNYNKGFSYDHVKSYQQYRHLDEIGDAARPNAASPPFKSNVPYNVSGQLNFYPRHTQLYTGFDDNVADLIEHTMPARISTLNELTNMKVEITVPGRTDIEVGAVVHYRHPDTTPRSESSKVATDELMDFMFTGYYLVTAIRHKITLASHTMILEMVKDSIGAGGKGKK